MDTTDFVAVPREYSTVVVTALNTHRARIFDELASAAEERDLSRVRQQMELLRLADAALASFSGR
jgi:hypothetical protein